MLTDSIPQSIWIPQQELKLVGSPEEMLKAYADTYDVSVEVAIAALLSYIEDKFGCEIEVPAQGGRAAAVLRVLLLFRLAQPMGLA